MKHKKFTRREFLINGSIASTLPFLPIKALASAQQGDIPLAEGLPFQVLKNSLRFNGMATDIRLGMQHLGNGFRAYRPALMRFNSMDSMSPFNKGGINVYEYVLGDPINYTDPSGNVPFKIGDIVYGISESRSEFFRKNGVNLTGGIGATIDSFAATKTEQKIMKTKSNAEYPSRQEDYFNFLSNHKKYSGITGKMGFIMDLEIPVDHPRNVRRKCKAGLEWAATSGIRVHFVLDGIDFEQVISKKSDSFTSAELRWVYRNWSNPKVQNSIQFWHDGNQVPAPWLGQQAKSSWGRYAPRSG